MVSQGSLVDTSVGNPVVSHTSRLVAGTLVLADRDLRRQCQDVLNKLEMQETNGIYLFVPRCTISPSS